MIARRRTARYHEFVRWARRGKNELRSAPEHRATVRRVEQALNDLERRDVV